MSIKCPLKACFFAPDCKRGCVIEILVGGSVDGPRPCHLHGNLHPPMCRPHAEQQSEPEGGEDTERQTAPAGKSPSPACSKSPLFIHSKSPLLAERKSLLPAHSKSPLPVHSKSLLLSK